MLYTIGSAAKEDFQYLKSYLNNTLSFHCTFHLETSQHSLIRQVLFTFVQHSASLIDSRCHELTTLVNIYALDEVLNCFGSRLKASLGWIGPELRLWLGCVSLGVQVVCPQWYKKSLQETGFLSPTVCFRLSLPTFARAFLLSKLYYGVDEEEFRRSEHLWIKK